MTLLLQALPTLLPVLYLVLAGLFGLELALHGAPRLTGLRHATTVATLLVHGAWLALIAIRVGHLPVVDLWTACSCLVFAVTLLYVTVQWIAGVATTGVFVVGFCFLMQLVASALATREPAANAAASSTFFAVHVGTAISAVAALLLSGFFGALYLILLRQIRRRQFGVLFSRLPDLDSLSRLNRGAATLGFLLLTVGINLGIWWAHSGAVADFNYLDPKVLPLLALWIVFGLIGASRWVGLLSGRRAAWMAVTAASLLVLALVVSFLPVGSIHHF